MNVEKCLTIQHVDEDVRDVLHDRRRRKWKCSLAAAAGEAAAVAAAEAVAEAEAGNKQAACASKKDDSKYMADWRPTEPDSLMATLRFSAPSIAVKRTTLQCMPQQSSSNCFNCNILFFMKLSKQCLRSGNTSVLANIYRIIISASFHSFLFLELFPFFGCSLQLLLKR